MRMVPTESRMQHARTNNAHADMEQVTRHYSQQSVKSRSDIHLKLVTGKEQTYEPSAIVGAQ